MPRVLFVIGALDRGGGETQLVALVERLHPERVEATIATLGLAADPLLRERLRARGVRHIVLGGRGPRAKRMVALGPSLLVALRVFRPDLVYAWLEQAAAIAAPAARAYRIPVAVARRNVSGPYTQWPRPVVDGIARAERLAAVVTANSEAVACEAVARGIAPERIRVVPNGHEVSPPLMFPPDDAGVALGYVAGFRAEKGHHRLVEALSHVRAGRPWHVDLAGDGPLRERIAEEVRARGLGDRVRFTGGFSDARAFWAERHVGVLLSDHEGLPNALIEAAMAGRPVVGTDVGGMPEVVGPGGFVVGADDPAATGAALAQLIDDAALRTRLGAAAHRHAAERFSMAQFVAGHHSAIMEAMGRPSA